MIYLDVTELVLRSQRTGIQRIERETLRYWPRPKGLALCLYTADGWAQLPDAARTVLTDNALDAASERASLNEMIRMAQPLAARDIRHMLNLELYHDAARADAHIALAASGTRQSWYIYDFLPYLHPQLFPPGKVQHLMHYLRALRHVDRLAFLSHQTRDEYAHSIAMRPADDAPIILPGADGLGLERQTFATSRRMFVAIGTIEPRKNTMALLDAFALLWSRGLDAHLTLAGQVTTEAHEAQAFLARHANEPRLTMLNSPSDAALRIVLRKARAVIMPSEAEGFGLPPYEAIHAGIPAIASARVPSAALLPHGLRALPRVTATTLADAVAELLDDNAAERAWQDAALARLPDWPAFATKLAAWADAG